MRRNSKILILLSLVFSPVFLNAKVFDYSSRAVATYLRGSYGSTALAQSVYKPAFPSSVAFPGDIGVRYAMSGEVGLSFRPFGPLNIRLGVEALFPDKAKDVVGVNSSAVELFIMTSDVFSLIPQVNIESYLREWKASRWILGLGGGYALTTIKNNAIVNDNGLVHLGIPSFTEEGSGTGIMLQGYTAFEFSFFDNVALTLEAGYRSLTVSNFTYLRDGNLPQGTVTKGAPMKNYDGSVRTANMSGGFGGASFRIYF